MQHYYCGGRVMSREEGGRWVLNKSTTEYNVLNYDLIFTCSGKKKYLKFSLFNLCEIGLRGFGFRLLWHWELSSLEWKTCLF